MIHGFLTKAADFTAPVGETASAELLGPIKEFAARGKRLRAALVIASHAANGGNNEAAAYDIAAAIELFQVAALIHDDVLDKSALRRGLPTTHTRLEALHDTSAWQGDHVHFGLSGAILAGDLALMATGHAVSRAVAALEPSQGSALGERFARMASLCTMGQYLDMRLAAAHTAHCPASAEDAIRVMRSKTASYTTEGPLALGAVVAGLTEPQADHWAAAGVPLGIAFQLRDDLLGSIGTSEETGKPSGDDISEGKWTLLAITALELADAAAREDLIGAFGNAEADAGQISAAIAALHSSGAVAAIEELIAENERSANSLLSSLPMLEEARAEIDRLVGSAVRRRA